MDYEQKYKDVLEQMRGFTPDERGLVLICPSDLFPELRESEDERIRKDLIAFVKSRLAGFPDCDRFIAWLEKQRQEKSIDISIKEKAHQIAWETSKHYDPDACKQEWCEMAAIDMAALLEKQGEQKPAWSEEDEEIPNLIIARLHSHPNVDLEEYSKEYDWLNYSLKSLKDRVQPKQEWSEEDERNLQGIIDEIKANKTDAPDYDIATYDRFLSWLNSLRPQNEWKPSDMELEVLRLAAEKDGTCLMGLYEQLKKLREE